eukprot:gnl/Hemi2/25110_TR8455_c0_g6_i2.p1 gnl/Hemi2/25110_TR8455_c0_g6~~gnl/Hemi2/25110_TR8455_c0_g6_i2.p1  ORF type:complete len:421 (-),score=128.09 gnl/Hemi2/25110_TR8455_c0_g6_i2:294-1556(-)
MGVWIGAGSCFETDKTSGVAHFLEHLAFKGTSRRTQQQLELEVESIGGHLNAYTSREQTVYYAKVLRKDAAQAMDILADIIQNSVFHPDAVEAERKTILQERDSVHKATEEIVIDMLHSTAYQGCQLGGSILGPVKNIETISQADCKDYVAQNYTAPRMVLSIAGGINHEEMVALAQKHFSKVPARPANGIEIPRPPSIFTGSDVIEMDDDLKQCHFAIAFEGVGWAHPDSFTMMVMQTLLGSGTACNKHLPQSAADLVRNAFTPYETEADKLRTPCSKIMSFNTCYRDTGLFGVYAACDPDLAQYVAFNIMKSGFQHLTHTVEEHEIERARNQLKAALALHLDTSAHVCEEIGRQLLTYGRRLTTAELFSRIESVDVEAVQHCANRYFRDRDIAFAALGKVKYMPDYTYLRRHTSNRLF